MKPSKPASMICLRSCCITEAVTAITGIARGRRIGAQHAERLDAVHAGQLDVHQDQIGLLLLRERMPSSRGPRLERPVALDLQDVAHELHVLLVVLDDQDQLMPASCGRSPDSVKVKVEPLPGLALDPDPAAVQLDEPAGQREAEAGAFLLAACSRAPTWRNSSKTASWSSGAMPMPVSRPRPRRLRRVAHARARRSGRRPA